MFKFLFKVTSTHAQLHERNRKDQQEVVSLWNQGVSFITGGAFVWLRLGTEQLKNELTNMVEIQISLLNQYIGKFCHRNHSICKAQGASLIMVTLKYTRGSKSLRVSSADDDT